MLKSMFILMVVFIVFIIFIRTIEFNCLFHPTKDVPVTPKTIGLAFEDVYFKTQDDIPLNGWLVKAPRAVATMIFLHGNAGNISHRLEKIIFFHKLGLNVFIIDYRGYGKSEGHPSEEALYKDAMAAYDFLLTRKDINRDKLIGYGESLGGIVAVDLAVKRKLACLIIDSSFTSTADISRSIFPFVPTIILGTKLDAENKIKNVLTPKMIIHSINDEVVPFYLGKKLFDAAANPKEFVQIFGGHNTNHVDSYKILNEALKKFLRHLSLI